MPRGDFMRIFVLTKSGVFDIIISVALENLILRGVAQFGRVLALGARCRRFKSCRLDQNKSTISVRELSIYFVLFSLNFSLFFLL